MLYSTDYIETCMFRTLPQITHRTPFNSYYFSIYDMLYINCCLSKKKPTFSKYVKTELGVYANSDEKMFTPFWT